MSHRRPRHSPRHRHTMPQTAARDTGNYSTSNGQQSRYAHTSSYHPPPPYRDRDFPGGPRTGRTSNQQHLHVQTDSYHSEPPPGGYFPDRSVVSHSPMTNHYQQNSHAQNSPYPSAPVRGGRYLKDDLRPASNGSTTYAGGAPIGQHMAYGTHGLKFRNTDVNIVGPDRCQSMYDHSSDLHINGGRHRVTRRGSGNTSGTTAPQPGRQSAFTGARGNVIENATIELIAGSESTGQYYHNYPY